MIATSDNDKSRDFPPDDYLHVSVLGRRVCRLQSEEGERFGEHLGSEGNEMRQIRERSGKVQKDAGALSFGGLTW